MMPDLQSDPLERLDLPAPVPPLRRQLRLTRLVEGFLAAKQAAGEPMAPLSAATDLAESLALLIDQFHDEGLSADSLDDALAASDLEAQVAQHWEETLKFVDLVRQNWPAILADSEGGAIDARARQRHVVEALVARWSKAPPAHPVIAAASTGSVASTALLLAAIARLPKGAVVFPGFDPDVEPGIWDAAGPDHPMGPFRGVFDLLKACPEDVADWSPTPPSPRRALLTQALRPAPVTDHWHRAASTLRDSVGDATAGLTLIEAESEREEADAIAVVIREALAVPERTVTMITPDAALSRRVTAALSRFDVVPDDTAGQPLAQSPPGILTRMIADAAAYPGDPVAIAGLLQHPLVHVGLSRKTHLAHARAFEIDVLRVKPEIGTGSVFPTWPDANEDQKAWWVRVQGILCDLWAGLQRGAPLSDLLQLHLVSLQLLTDDGGDEGPHAWRGDAGPELKAFLDRLTEQSDAYGTAQVPDYPALINALLRGEQVRPKPRQPHPRVSICGPREARLECANLVILSGLNDGVWPEPADPGPWLSRPMHAALGLPLPERSVGLSAHDFLCGASSPEAVLTRARKADGVATVPSRWLIRMETLLKGIGSEDAWNYMRDRGRRYVGIAETMAEPEQPVPRVERPAPVPPPDARPRQLSVTRIETLTRDAYAIYARHVLGLKPLDRLGRAPDARDRGTVFHDVLEAFVRQTMDWPGREDAGAAFDRIADEVLAQKVPWPDLRRVWRARIARFGQWFLDEEATRRATGRPLGVEISGEMELSLPGGPFFVTAKADRVDRLQDGTGAVYDYKTGKPPSEKTIDVRFNHQLHVQAAILAAGGFKEIPAMEASTGAYIGLTGQGDGGAKVERPGLGEEVAEHMAYVVELLSAFDTGAPYLSRGRPQKLVFEGEYDHLARRGEWEREEES
jgi:double-strand break repair protein AddB